MNHTVVCEMWEHITETIWLPVLSGNYIWHLGETTWAGPQPGVWCCCLPPASPGQMLRVPERFLWLSAAFESLGWELRNDYSSGHLTASQRRSRPSELQGSVILEFPISKYAYSLVRPFSQLSSNREQENKCQCIMPISYLCINSFWISRCLKTQ